MLLSVLSGNFSPSMVIGSAVASLILIFLVSPLHELAHGTAALALGDKTPKWQGRITLNPLAHIDWIGALMIILFGFGWAKPVQVDIRNFKNPKAGMAVTAIAGPLSNFLIAFIAAALFVPITRLCYPDYAALENPSIIVEALYYCYSYFITLNVYIGLFNLIPFPPLDGSRILSAVLPNKYYYKLLRYERYSFVIFVVAFYVLDLGKYLSVFADGIINRFIDVSYLIFF